MKVFISHSHSQTDEPLVRKVTTALQQAGLEVWDERMEVFLGDNWAEKIAQALSDRSGRRFWQQLGNTF